MLFPDACFVKLNEASRSWRRGVFIPSDKTRSWQGRFIKKPDPEDRGEVKLTKEAEPVEGA